MNDSKTTNEIVHLNIATRDYSIDYFWSYVGRSLVVGKNKWYKFLKNSKILIEYQILIEV